VLEVSRADGAIPFQGSGSASYDYRTWAWLCQPRSMLMIMGIPYDSEEARGIAGAITAIMTGVAYKTFR